MHTYNVIRVLAEVNILRQEQNYEITIRRLMNLIQLYGEDPRIQALVAYCHFALACNDPDETGDNYQQAITWMEKAIASLPNDAKLYAILAEYYSIGVLDYKKSAQLYRQAIQLNPNDAWILSNAAALYGVPEQVVTRDEAIAWLERATQQEPDEPNYLFRLGSLYAEAGRFEDSARVWLQSLLCSRPLDLGATQAILEAINGGVG